MVAPAPEAISAAIQQRIAAAGVTWRHGRALDLSEENHPVVVGRVCDGEPLVRTEVALGRWMPDRVVKGLGAVALVCGANRALLAVNRDEAEVVALLRREAEGTLVEVVPLPPRCPMDAPSVLGDLAAAVGKSVPAAGLDRALVLGAAVLADVARALEGHPPFRRAVTVAGAVGEPRVVRVPLGTTVDDLVQACGGCDDPGWVAHENGLLAGRRVDRDHTVEPATWAVVVLRRDHRVTVRATTPVEQEGRRVPSACVNCRVCTDVCPVFLNGGPLQPHAIMASLAAGWPGSEQKPGDHLLAALHCTGCAVCNTLCPAGLHPADVVSELANTLADCGARPVSPPPLRLHPDRAGRRQGIARIGRRLGLSDDDAPGSLIPGQFIPETLSFPPTTRLGAARTPLVKPGDRVARGDALALVAATTGEVDTRSPTAGHVLDVDQDDGIVLRVQ